MSMKAFAKSEKTRFKMKVGVFLVLYQEDKVLLLQRHNTGIADGRHVLPMGSVEESETAIESMIREAKEEINVVITSEMIELAHTMHRLHHLPDGNSFKQIDLFFRVKEYSGQIQNMEPHKCSEVRFYELSALPKTTEAFICQALEHIQRGSRYSECGW